MYPTTFASTSVDRLLYVDLVSASYVLARQHDS